MTPKSGNAIFSPRAEAEVAETQFSYPPPTTSAPAAPASPARSVTSSTNKQSNSATPLKKRNLPEEVPMLQNVANDRGAASSGSEEEDVSRNRKWAERQFSDFKDFKPEPAARTTVGSKILSGAARTTDHYVNVPSSTVININNKSPSYKLKDAVSNPSYVAFGKVNETRT